MNQVQKRIAIAKACGKWSTGWPHDYVTLAERLRYIPDYLNDLNAMHAAEEVLTAAQLSTYCNVLRGIVEERGVGGFAYIFTATAAQRADAFCTLDLWETHPAPVDAGNKQNER